VFRRYRIQNDKDGIQIQVYNIINDSLHHSRQFMSLKVNATIKKAMVSTSHGQGSVLLKNKA